MLFLRETFFFFLGVTVSHTKPHGTPPSLAAFHFEFEDSGCDARTPPGMHEGTMACRLHKIRSAMLLVGVDSWYVGLFKLTK